MYPDEIAANNLIKRANEGDKLKGKLIDLASFIDEQYKGYESELDIVSLPAAKFSIRCQLTTLAMIAGKIEKDFGITVFTSPRD